MLDHQALSFGKYVEDIEALWDNGVAIRSTLQVHTFSGGTDEGFADGDGACLGSTRLWKGDRIILDLTDREIGTRTLVGECAHVHAHTFGSTSGPNRNRDGSRLFSEAGPLESEFARSERTVVVPIDEYAPPIAQEERPIGHERHAIRSALLQVGRLCGEVGIPIVITARVVQVGELDPFNVEDVSIATITGTIGLSVHRSTEATEPDKERGCARYPLRGNERRC